MTAGYLSSCLPVVKVLKQLRRTGWQLIILAAACLLASCGEAAGIVAAGYLSSCLPIGQVLEQLRGRGQLVT